MFKRVTMPFTGFYILDVEASSDEEAIDAFYERVDKEGFDFVNNFEFEFVNQIVTGNVFYGQLNEVEIEDIDEVEI